MARKLGWPEGRRGRRARAGAQDNLAATPPELLDRLDEAAATCGERDRIVFFHHPSTFHPYPVNWALEHNVPAEQVEMLVEIASGHGAFECRDTGAEGCEFRINDADDNAHLGWGSIQEALSLGYRLGFLGGGDRHDGRPGGVDLEPSYLGYCWDTDGDEVEDTCSQLHDPGAITGALVDGSYTRTSLWDALTARRTLASTGPRGVAALAAIGVSGELYLTGDVVPAQEFPLRLAAGVFVTGGAEVERIELLEPDGGAILCHAEGSWLMTDVVDPTMTAIYVRARVWDGGEEHRVWVSPLFVE